MTATTLSTSTQPGKALRSGLWLAQLLLAAMFIPAGLWKLSQPIAVLSQSMPWTGQMPEALVRFTGLVDLAGGLGVLLPALTRILPWLTVWAARGIVALQVLAGAFHLYRGETMLAPANLVLLAMALFVAWGRGSRAPIAARGGV